MRKAGTSVRSAALAATAAIVLAACTGGGDDGAAGSEPTKGGTLTFLTGAEQFEHLDPQRNYTGQDLAFAGAYLTRSLTSFKLSTDEAESNTLVPDLATNTGTPAADSTSWSFTLKEGPKFQDGTPITCEDVKYGVSRTFASDVITDGPQYAVSMLDIPADKDMVPVYKGPYVTKGNDTAAFDRAVTCDGQTITFHLARPVPDFNYTVTLSAFAPVPKDYDIREKYDDKLVSSGPYKIDEYSKNNQLVLSRNENWDPETDDIRGAYPDKVVVKFGIGPSVRDQRIIRDSGDDQFAATNDDPDPDSLSRIFEDDRLEDRRVDVLDAFAYYYPIDVNKVSNLKHRQAIAAALDRARIIKVAGGDFAGEVSDGVIKPKLPRDYAESGMWTELLGKEIPDSGDPEYARALIEESGEPMPAIRFTYETPARDEEAAVVQESLENAGIRVELKPLEAEEYDSVVFDPAKSGEMMWGAWAADWPNASTIIPELFTPSGGYNLSQVDDEDFNVKVEEAKAATDRDAQSQMWKDLNKAAMSNVWAVPTRNGRKQRVAGSKVGFASSEDGNAYLWAPFSSWPYQDMYLKR